MKAHLVKVVTVVMLFTFGLGLVLGRSGIGKHPVASPAKVTVR